MGCDGDGGVICDLYLCIFSVPLPLLKIADLRQGSGDNDMTRPEACEGRSVRQDKDATCRVVAKRLAWLAKDDNWDGTLPPSNKSTPKQPLPPPSSGDCIHGDSISG